jgi:hypothetical protein
MERACFGNKYSYIPETNRYKYFTYTHDKDLIPKIKIRSVFFLIRKVPIIVR